MNRFSTAAPYSEEIFVFIARRMEIWLPVNYLGKVIVDSKDFRLKKIAMGVDPANDIERPAGERERYTHGYFVVTGRQVLLELTLFERNDAWIDEDIRGWHHFWKLIPVVIAPWETPGIGVRNSPENSHEELRVSGWGVKDWRLESASGLPSGMSGPHDKEGNIQFVSGQLDLGSSSNEDGGYSMPERVTNVVGQILLASRLLVHASDGGFTSLRGILFPIGGALTYVQGCEQHFCQEFPIRSLLEHCSDPQACRRDYEEFVAVQTKRKIA